MQARAGEVVHGHDGVEGAPLRVLQIPFLEGEDAPLLVTLLDELFTDDAITQIHQAARGKPRTVNNIAIAALIATAGAGKNLVDNASARAAIAEVTATD